MITVRIEKSGQKCCHRKYLQGKVNDWIGMGEGDQLEVGTISNQTVKAGEQVWEEKESGVSFSAHGVSISKMSRQENITFSAWTQPPLTRFRVSLLSTVTTSYMWLFKCMLIRI